MRAAEKIMTLLGRKPSSSGAEGLREAVREAYSKAADRPGGKHPFPVGRCFAESVGFSPELLDSLPHASVGSFTGVSNVSVFAEIPEGSTVLDVGCGCGLDALIAAGKAGRGGRVMGVDFSGSMIRRASEAAEESGLDNVSFLQADAERLPVDNGTVDVVLANGIFNLNPMREEIFREMFRVLRPGGAVYASELILAGPEEAGAACDLKSWFA